MNEVFFTAKMPCGETLYISNGCKEVYGYTPEEFKSDPDLWYKVIVDEDKPVVFKNGEVLARGEILEHEYRITRKDGAIRWLHSRIHPTLSKDGKLTYIDGFKVDVTEQKLAEKALRDSEYRFRSLIQNNSDAIHILNEDCEITFASESLYKVLGYRPSEIIGRKSYEFVYEADREKIKAHFQRCLATPGRSLSIQYRRVKKDGTVIWCEGTVINMLHVPEVAGVVLNYRNITKRIEVEQALQASERRFRSLIEHNTDGIVVIDPDSVVHFASESFYKMTGYTASELEQQCSYQFIHPEDVDRLQKHHQKILENPGKTFQIIYRRLHKNGNYLWLEGTGTNMLHVPEINGIVLNIRDISERIAADEAIRNSEHKLKSLVAHSSDAITITSRSLELIFASESWHRMTGYQSLEYFKDFEEIHPDDRTAAKDFLKDLLKYPGETRSISFRLKRRDGQYIWLERVAVNMINDPAINGIISNFRDITDHRKHTEALTAANIHLKKVNMELDKFVYRVSHDLRAPLLSILGLIQLSEQEQMNDALAEYIKMMKSSVEKLDVFIAEILDYSRNARTEVKQEPIYLKKCVDELADQLRFVKTGADVISFENEIPEDLVIVSDKTRVAVILNNLISNAIRYADTTVSNPFVRIRAEHTESCLQVSIADNGIGIAEQHQPKIFDMFYRASAKSNGSGMGLYIVKETIEKMNGKISVVSSPGKGSEFIFCLPCLDNVPKCNNLKPGSNT